MSKTNSIAKYITPAEGFLLVEIISSEQPEAFSIADNNESPQRGRVIAIGEDSWHEHFERQLISPAYVGDVVVHSGYGYEDIRVQGEKFRLVPFSKVIAVIKKEDYAKVQ